ncbi:MAG: hypothetical protein WC211_09505 [Dehalococcoidia bacterium]
MATHRFLDPTAPLGADSPRWRLLAALGLDLLALLTMLLAAAASAMLWLLTRTQAGRIDVTPADGAVALSLIAAALPAWVAIEWFALLRIGRTVGGRVAGLDAAAPVRGPARALLLLLHPASAVLWAWLAAGAALLDATPATEALALLAAAVLLLSLASLLRLLLRPDAEALHMTLARRAPGGRG